MTTYVIDSSAGVDFALETDAGQRLSRRMEDGAQWWVPEHYFAEVASALRRAERRGDTEPARAQAQIASLAAGPVHGVSLPPFLAEAWRRRGHLTIYDALYVVVAAYLGATLVTSDLRLAGSPGLDVPALTP